MIIRSSRLSEGTTVTQEGKDLIVRRTVNLEPLLVANYESRKDPQNGFSGDRSYRLIARIDFDTFNNKVKEHPELLAGDKELREKTLWKVLHEEDMRQFWTVNKGI